MCTVPGRSLVVDAFPVAAVQVFTGCASDRIAFPPADTVLRNGKIVTVDAASSVAQAMAVRDACHAGREPEGVRKTGSEPDTNPHSMI